MICVIHNEKENKIGNGMVKKARKRHEIQHNYSLRRHRKCWRKLEKGKYFLGKKEGKR